MLIRFRGRHVEFSVHMAETAAECFVNYAHYCDGDQRDLDQDERDQLTTDLDLALVIHDMHESWQKARREEGHGT